MVKTIFEKIVVGEIPSSKIYEDDNFYAFLDIKPKTKGHTLVITKKPYRNFLHTPEEVVGEYFKVIKKIAEAVKKGIDADGLNITTNIEPAGWQEVFHTHVHIIPRFENDNVDLNPGSHEVYKEGEMEEIKNKIITNL